MADQPSYQELQNRIARLASERARVEQELRQVQDRFRQVFYASPDAMNINRFEDGIYIDINEGFSELTGYSREDVIGESFLTLNLWQEVGIRQQFIDRLLKTGSVKEMEARFVRKDGKVLIGLVSARVLQFGDEKVVLSITRDITSKKLVEEALRDGESRFRDLTEMLPEAVFETDEKLTLIYANRRAFELFGYTSRDIQIMAGLDFLVPEDRERACSNMMLRLTGRDPGTVEYRALRKDGSRFPVMFHASPIERQGTFAGLRGIIVDLSRLKQAEEEKARIEAHYRQAQKVEAIGRLAGGVAHDLNNTLAPIIGYAELLLQDYDPTDSRREYVDQIIRAGYGARDLVRQLLAFSRKQTLEYKPLHLNTTILEFEKLLRRTIREDIDLEIITSTDIGMIKADVGQIEQVIMNLAVNAQDAMPDGGRLTIRTEAAELDEAYVAEHTGAQPGPHVMLAVSDTGCGFDQETHEHLFEPFFSTKGDQGTGLGLATVYGIVKQHGGSIWPYSEAGVGTTFKIFLPVAGSTTAETTVSDRPRSTPKGSGTILLVEDNEQVRELAHDILTHWGYRLLVADSGQSALDLLASHDGGVDLLLTDVVMPDMNGKELYEKVAALDPDIRVLYMSGYTDDVIAQRGVLDEGVLFLQKPFTVNGLAAKVREAFEQD